VPIVEYHIDTSYSFQKRMGEEGWLGGRRSMQYLDITLLITWGHDEMIMKQYLLTKKKLGMVLAEKLESFQRMEAWES
jgi:hypothetical protein